MTDFSDDGGRTVASPTLLTIGKDIKIIIILKVDKSAPSLCQYSKIIIISVLL